MVGVDPTLTRDQVRWIAWVRLVRPASWAAFPPFPIILDAVKGQAGIRRLGTVKYFFPKRRRKRCRFLKNKK